jgi:UDP:flavonoid glycosyltransferase YjiC (YdhE family)
MRVLFTLMPGTGSLHPLLPLAAAVRGRGHDVAFASAPRFEPAVRQHGFSYFAAGLDWLVSDPDYIQTLCVAAGGLEFPALTGPERFAWVTDNLFIGGAARTMLPALLRIGDQWQPDLIVRESLEFAGCVAAERMGIPHASVAASADCALDKRQRMARPLGDLRAAVGLPSDADLGMAYRHLHLCFEPPSFHEDDARFPSTTRFLRNELRHSPILDVPVGSRPRVLVSLGTVFHRTPGLIDTIVEALHDEPVDLDVAVGFDQDVSRLGPQPSNVHLAPWLPIDEMLQRSDALVTHGGFNSVKEALTVGVPMVVVPIAGDQPYSAARCTAIGVAEMVSPEERTVERVRTATRAILDNPAYRTRAHELRAEIASLPKIDEAIPMLEALVDADAQSTLEFERASGHDAQYPISHSHRVFGAVRHDEAIEAAS